MSICKKRLWVIVVLLALIVAGLGVAVFWRNLSMHRFRTMQDLPCFSRIVKDPTRALSINRQGMDAMLMSGSGFLQIEALAKYRDKLNKPMVVISLLPQDEPYIAGYHLKYYCLTFSKYDIIKLKPGKSRFTSAACAVRRRLAGIIDLSPLSLQAMTTPEQDLLAQKGIGYKRTLYAPHQRGYQWLDIWVQDWSWVDEFLAIVKEIPEDTALHFHCANGCGRTTTCMILYDIYKNHAQVSLKDIIDRQWALGGEDVLDTVHRPGGSWSQEKLDGRKKLVEAFYAYMNDTSSGYGKTSFVEWSKRYLRDDLP